MDFTSDISAHEKKMLTSVEAAELFGVTNDYITQLCRKGKVEGRLLGRSWVVGEDSLRAYLADSRSRRLVQREYLSRSFKAPAAEASAPQPPVVAPEQPRAAPARPRTRAWVNFAAAAVA